MLHLTQSFGLGLTSSGGAGGAGGGGGDGDADFTVDLSMSSPANLGGPLTSSFGGRAGTGGGTGAGNGTAGGGGDSARSSVAELRLRATLGLARVALQRGTPQLCPALARRLDLTLALALTLAHG